MSTDGAVPSVKGSTDPHGRPINAVEDWQQGMAVVTYEPGNGNFNVELIPISRGEAIFRGKYFSRLNLSKLFLMNWMRISQGHLTSLS